MDLPPGLSIQGENTQLVCKLNKSLYGLKQASRQWFLKFSTVLMQFGLKKSSADHSFFCKIDQNSYLGVIIYVDILIATSDTHMVEDFKNFLGSHFNFKDLGFPRYFLGLEITSSEKGISVSQRKHSLDLLLDVGLIGCKPLNTPMECNVHLRACTEDSLPDSKPNIGASLVDCYILASLGQILASLFTS